MTRLLLVVFELTISGGILDQTVDAKRQVRAHLAIHVNRGPALLETASAQLNPREVLAETCNLGRCVDQAGGRTFAKENGVGPAGELQTLGVVGIEIELRAEKIPGTLGAGDAADAKV